MNKETKNIMLLLLRGQTTNFGNIIFDYANKVLIAGLTAHSSFFMMVYQTSESIIQLVFNLFAGHLADFGNRKHILIVTDTLAGIATLVLFLTYNPKEVWMLILVNAILALLFSFNSPAYKAIIKDLLTKKGIYQYNSWSKIVAEVVSVGAPLVSVFIIQVFGFRYGMLINSISFFISAICEHFFYILSYDNPGPTSSFWSGLQGGFRYIYKDKPLLLILIASAFLNFLDAIYSFYLPFTSSFSHFHHIYGYILVAQSIGNIIGAGITGLHKKQYSPKDFFHLLLPSSISLILVEYASFSQILLLILFAIFSTTVTMFNVNLMSHLQVSVHSHFLGRVFSIIFTISGIFIPFGSLVASSINLKNWSIFQYIGWGQVVIYIACIAWLHMLKE